MGFSRAQVLWRFLQPQAFQDGIVPVRPQVDAIDFALRVRIQDVMDALDVAKSRIQTLEQGLTAMRARVTALEAKVP